MSVSSSEVKKRPSGIIIIAVLWVLTSLYVLYWGIETMLFDLSYDPNAPELLELSLYARAWLGWGVRADLVLCFCIVAVSMLMVFVAYGLYTATPWSYNSALAIPAVAAFVHGSTAAFYRSAPIELGFSYDLPLHSALTLINLIWLAGIWIYARKPFVKQYIVGSPLKPILPTSQPAPSTPRTSTQSGGEREEKIIKAIVSAGSPLTWNEILQATNLDQDSLNKALAKLFRAKAIQKIGETGDVRYKVYYDLYKRYQAQLRLDANIERRTELLKWISQ
jgi:predicted transcriptional regulator